MSYFFSSAARTPKELAPGIVTRTFWGERALLSLVDLDANASVPPHSHPHEQMGVVMKGELEFTIGGETRVLRAGDVFVAPGGVEHRVRVGGEPCQVVEVFAPVREEYKFPD